MVLVIFWTLLIGLLGLFYVGYQRSRRNQRVHSRSYQPDYSQPVRSSSVLHRPVPSDLAPSGDFSNLRSRLHKLAINAWTTEAAFRHPRFLLRVEDLAHLSEPTQVVEVLLRHAELVAPGFEVPQMIPRVLSTSIPFAAGQFEVDEDGWVTIKLGSEFFQDKLAAQAILAHEVCHYILENKGIRQQDYLLNEQDTDLCMFVCGFGSLFLAGYQREAAQHDYRPGHRLGYLNDAEYQFAQQEIMQMRSSTEVAPPSELDAVKTRLINLLYGDQAACQRYVEAERTRNPHQSERQLYQAALDRLEHDRR
ncbi:MAG: hypothetical protein LH660_20820 [Phormidesmis sp. CAN_BIN36]|nr:hypothetical protein [Phormidesmis sp. CAN_BIN36]